VENLDFIVPMDVKLPVPLIDKGFILKDSRKLPPEKYSLNLDKWYYLGMIIPVKSVESTRMISRLVSIVTI
jgi:hypothetical protein